MKTKISAFFKSETVLCIAAVLALLSCFAVPPSKAYAGYINFSTLAMLFSLMAVVAGLRSIGVFDLLSRKLMKLAHGITSVTLILVLLCFFMSMFLTNDVTLVTLVPFTILVFSEMNLTDQLIFPLTMETVAANLGSMMLPFGNPQNLYLYSNYSYSMDRFVKLMFPYTAVSLVLIVILTLVGMRYVSRSIGKVSMNDTDAEVTSISKRHLIIYLVLFLVSIASVARLIDWRIAFVIVLVSILVVDRRLIRKVDYSLLITFVFFFVFIGNLGNITAFQTWLASILSGREVLTSVITSQFASNVPAAILLSGFTDQGAGLIIGTNLGGLGTLIASMASLITYKFFAEKCPNQRGRYLLVFSIVNVFLLIILYFFYGTGGQVH